MNNNQVDDQWVRNQFKIQEFLVRMLRQRSSINIDEKAFLSLYNRFLTLNTKEPINWDQVQHPGEQRIKNYEDLTIPDEKDIASALSRLVILKFNGDLGTSMNFNGTKSLIQVKNEKSFLEICIQQIDVNGNSFLAILCWLEEQEKSEESRIDFLMEITDKTSGDKKEGTLILYDGVLKFLGLSQVSKEHVEEFLYSEQFKIFNTNSMWINIKTLQDLLDSGSLEMDLIVNRKTMRDETKVIQLEESAASAISNFKKAMALKVPRNRFLSVRSTSDLLILRSDIFEANFSGPTLTPLRTSLDLPTIRLGSRFKSIEDLQRRIPSTPSLLNLRHLTLSGDIYFGSNVVLKGSVKILAKNNEQIMIPDGTVLEDQVVIGNFQDYRRHFFT
ncbi:unnamed protein product [Hymenolepis diminuta]|uniref:UTP--glucose-1-phosphate uridylyltransferase n=1 Tax=Hymenolepis diminuta TaxID=6216 RepID=A0A0R3S8H4_HYMDI|nr:unnamed protein product [Hymenolepis diminuta]